MKLTGPVIVSRKIDAAKRRAAEPPANESRQTFAGFSEAAGPGRLGKRSRKPVAVIF